MSLVNEFFSFQNGYAFKSSDFVYKGKYKIIKIKELKDGLVKFFDDTAEINVPVNFDVDKYIVRKGDVLFALTGDPVNKPNPLSWVGRVSYYDHDEPALLNQRVCKAIPKGNIPGEYLYYFFRQEKEFYRLASKATGSASQANISTKTIEQHPITVPAGDISGRIIDFLRNIDVKISVNEAINRNLSEQAFALFKEMFPNVNQGEHTLGEYLSAVKGKALLSKDAVEGDVPVIAGGLSPATYHNVANTKAPVLTISASGANAGYVALWNVDVWSSDSSYIDSNMTENVYFWYVMLKTRQKEIFDAHTGSVQPHIYPKNIDDLSVAELDRKIVTDYTMQVSPLFELIGKNIKENERLIILRDSLLPKLMSGDLNVSNLYI